MDILKMVLEIASNILEVENIEITEDKELMELGLNSITFIRCIIEIEQKFDIEFDDDYLDFQRYTSISQLCDYIKRKVAVANN